MFQQLDAFQVTFHLDHDTYRPSSKEAGEFYLQSHKR